MHDVIKGCLEVLQQAKNFLNSVSDDAYTKVVKPFFISSSGEHVRHIIDHFMALMNAYESGVVDYDKRKRGSKLETDKSLALLQVNEIEKWLHSLDENMLEQVLMIKTEVSISEALVTEVSSTFARELVFAASHAVHHYSSIAIAIQMQDLALDKSFGIAPATASYLRSKNKSCAHSAG